MKKCKRLWEKISQGNKYLKSKFSYEKIWINFTLTFLIPFVVLSYPKNVNTGSTLSTWFNNFLDKMDHGLLFSTALSIAATYISTFVSRMNDSSPGDHLNKEIHTEDKSSSSNLNLQREYARLKQDFVFFSKYSQTLLFAMLSLIVSTTFLHAVSTNEPIRNWITITFQIILYIFILGIYGHTEKNIEKKNNTLNHDDMNKYNRSEDLKKQSDLEKSYDKISQALLKDVKESNTTKGDS